MKYYITDNNMKSTQGIRDIPYFSNTTERDQWVSTHLLNGKTIDEALNSSYELNTQVYNIQSTEIEIEYTSELVNKNYVLVKDNISKDILFYIITSKEMSANSNMVLLSLELDVLMTYPTIIDNLNNFELTQGHSQFGNYFDYDFDGGRRYIESISKQKDNIGYTVVVYRKLHSNEEGAVVNGITLPYKIFIAPEKAITIIDNNDVEKVVSKENLIEYYNKKADGLTYNIQIIPYVLFNESDTVNHKYKVNDREANKSSIVHFENILELKMYTFNEPEDVKNNTYNIDLSPIKGDIHNFNILPGLEDSKLAIEGVKEIDWPFNQVDNTLDNLDVRLGTFLAPNEMENFYTFNNQPYYKDSENTWTNETELAIFVNQLNEYKANNPVSSKLGILGSVTGGALVGAGIGSRASKGNPEIIGASLATGAFIGAAGSTIGRANRKKAPENVKGGTNTYGILSNAKYPFNLVDIRYDYKGNDRLSIFNILYKYGLEYDSSLFTKSYNDIKRPIFNFMKLNNITSSQLNMDLPNEVIVTLGDVLSTGIRVWNDTTKFLQYEDDLSGNGDKI